MLQALMDAKYKDGSRLSDEQVAHLMIALLMAGQHTSSTTSSWLLSYLAANPECQSKLRQEARDLAGGEGEFDLDHIRAMDYTGRCIKEALRLRPPIITLMRKVVKDQKYKGYTIPAGDYLCCSPALSQLDEKIFQDAEAFSPDRFQDLDMGDDEDEIRSLKYAYSPFGGGRHRCIGESFADVQVGVLWRSFLV